MPTAAQYQNLVIASLSAADPSAQLDLTVKVPVFWTMYALKARWPDIRFWYVYRESVRLLMGRTRQATDQSRRNSRGTGNSQSDTTANGSSNGQASSNSSEHGRSSTGRLTTKRTDGSSTSSGSSNFSSSKSVSSQQRHDDIGSGGGSQSSTAARKITGFRTNYTIDGNSVKGSHFTGHTKNANTRFTDYSGHNIQDKFEDITIAIVGGTKHKHDKVLAQAVTRRVTGLTTGGGTGGVMGAEGHDIHQSSLQDSSHNFNANATDSSSGSSFFTANGSGSRVENSSEIGLVDGSMQLTARMDKHAVSVGSTLTIDTTLGLSHAESQSAAHYSMQKLQQRFKHLDALWKEATLRIKQLESQAVVAERYQIAAMSIVTVNDFPDKGASALANLPSLRGLGQCPSPSQYPL